MIPRDVKTMGKYCIFSFVSTVAKLLPLGFWSFFIFKLVVFADLDMAIITSGARNQTFTKAAAFSIKQQS